MKRRNVVFMCMVAIFSCCLLIGTASAESLKAYMGISPDGNKKIVNIIKEKTGIGIEQTMQSYPVASLKNVTEGVEILGNVAS